MVVFVVCEVVWLRINSVDIVALLVIRCCLFVIWLGYSSCVLIVLHAFSWLWLCLLFTLFACVCWGGLVLGLVGCRNVGLLYGCAVL